MLNTENVMFFIDEADKENYNFNFNLKSQRTLLMY